jgi:DNA segregation ATPase FtsK/SpoIIIE, S-DNA-T family
MSKRRSSKLVRWHWEVSPEVERSISAIILIALGTLFALAYFKSAGIVGHYIDVGLAYVFGLDRLIMSIVFIGLGLTLLFRGHLRGTVILGAFFSLLSLNALLQVITVPAGTIASAANGGGAIGLFLSGPLVKLLSLPGAVVILCAILIAGLVLVFDASLASFGEVLKLIALPFRKLFAPGPPKQKQTAIKGIEDIPEEEPEEKPEEENDEEEEKVADDDKSNRTNKTNAGVAPVFTVVPLPRRIHRRIEIPLDLLETRSGKASAGDIRANQEVIRRTLEQFNIPVEMGDVSVGPTVTQYTLKPSEGIKLSKIINLSNDLALALAAHPIRIEAPIPGKSLVGIEVPNQTVAVVKIREGIESPNFHLEKYILPIVLGKDVAGEPWVADVARMPHMLVAGATGSGKTVCLNTIIVSLLFRMGPDDLKFIMIDPKRVELPCYNGIPHLLTPVITEVPKIVNSLKWCIGEMERRFDLLAKLGRRDIASYNHEVDETIKKNSDSPLSRLPYIVVVIDELADLMATSAQEVEGSIVRLAQLARAVGIHLIVATQRPSVDVITGLIKANITTRIAFAVATSTDSRTIIDTSGAEKLLGRGDMLYTTAELSKPKRLQGAYVNDEEIRRVVDYLKSHAEEEPEYRTDIVERPKATGPSGETYDDSEDELLPEARDLVVAAGKASASLLQRRLKVGYARAARLLDLMETQGVIGPGEGAKPRAILVKKSTAGIPVPGDESAGSATIFVDEMSEPSDDDAEENI